MARLQRKLVFPEVHGPSANSSVTVRAIHGGELLRQAADSCQDEKRSKPNYCCWRASPSSMATSPT